MDDDLRFYVIGILLALLAAASIVSLNAIIIVASLAAAGFLVAFYRLHYLIDAVIFRRSNLVQIVNGFELSGERTAALRKVQGNYSATAAGILEGNPKKGIDRDNIENVVANLHLPFRFVLQIEYINIKKVLDKLETKRNLKEIELARIKGSGPQNEARTNALKRQIECLEHDLERMRTGGIPLRISQYLMTSALSGNRFAAQEKAKSQLRELGSHFSAITGSNFRILEGNDLLDLLAFDSAVNR